MTIHRRDLLKLAGVTAGAGLVGALVPSARARGRGPIAPRRLILVFATGGWDTSYALDPKEPAHVDIPAGAVQRFAGLDVFTDASRPSVTEFFTRYAANTAIVRGITTDAITHNECQRRIATGTREETHADMGAMVAHDLGNDLPLPYLILGDVAFVGPYAASTGRVGTGKQLVDLLGTGATGESVTGSTSDRELSTSEEDLIAGYARASIDRARATRGATGANRRRVDDFAASIDRAARLRALHGRFGARGEALTMDGQIAIALDALEQDISHAVMVTTQQPWDTHGDNFLQAANHEVMFAGLTRLVDELIRRPGRAAGDRMIDDTVVVCFSEMSRSAHLAGDPVHAGKDHWPVTAAMVIGAGVAGGRVVGATTPDAQAVAIDLATGAPADGGTRPLYTHFVAGLLALCGVDPAAHLGDPKVLDAFIA